MLNRLHVLGATDIGLRFLFCYGRKFQGAKVPYNFRSRERKFQGTKVPGTKVPGSESTRANVPSMVLSLLEAKVRGNESSIIRNNTNRAAELEKEYIKMRATYHSFPIAYNLLFRCRIS